MSISIRRERETPPSDKEWAKEYINKIYEASKSQIAQLLPHYNSNIVTWNGEFIGYDFSKEFSNPESKGKFHLTIRLSNYKYLSIQFIAEGRYRVKGDRTTTSFVKVIFSIEQDVKKRYYEPQLAEIDIRDEAKKHENEIKTLQMVV